LVNTLLIEFQYKALHLLTEIRDGVNEVVSLLRAEQSSFSLEQLDNLNDFKDFDTALEEKKMEKLVVSGRKKYYYFLY